MVNAVEPVSPPPLELLLLEPPLSLPQAARPNDNAATRPPAAATERTCTAELPSQMTRHQLPQTNLGRVRPGGITASDDPRRSLMATAPAHARHCGR